MRSHITRYIGTLIIGGALFSLIYARDTIAQLIKAQLINYILSGIATACVLGIFLYYLIDAIRTYLIRIDVFTIIIRLVLYFVVLVYMALLGKWVYGCLPLFYDTCNWCIGSPHPPLFDDTLAIKVTNGENLPQFFYYTRSLLSTSQTILTSMLALTLPLFVSFGFQRVTVLFTDYQNLLRVVSAGFITDKEQITTLQKLLKDQLNLVDQVAKKSQNYFYVGFMIAFLCLLFTGGLTLYPGIGRFMYIFVPALNAAAVLTLFFLVSLFLAALFAIHPIESTITFNSKLMEAVKL